MTEQSLTKKLHLKPGYRTLVWNAPNGYIERLRPLPENVELTETPGGTFDFVHLFIADRAELDRYAPPAMKAVQRGGLLWISYPKQSSKVRTDITHDVGWEVVETAGWRGVAQISIDDVWSALRFKPAELAGESGRSSVPPGR